VILGADGEADELGDTEALGLLDELGLILTDGEALELGL
jgi:hypothetical protein